MLSGTPYPAGLLKGLIQHYMSKPQTTARALLLLLSLVKIAGHMQINLVSYYRKLAKVYGFRLVVTTGAEALSSDATVPNNTFTVGATNDRVPTLQIFDTPSQRSARDQVRRDKDKQADIASRRRANQRVARDAARSVMCATAHIPIASTLGPTPA